MGVSFQIAAMSIDQLTISSTDGGLYICGWQKGFDFTYSELCDTDNNACHTDKGGQVFDCLFFFVCVFFNFIFFFARAKKKKKK